jgi:hypothetical protein
MTRGTALPCPSCKRSYEALDWIDANHCRCLKCEADFDFFPFPALVATREVVKPQAVAVAEDSTCFFHADNQAEKLCDSCGRFLCAVCAVPFTGKTLCPPCIAVSKKEDVQFISSRPLPGGTALALALLPMLLWPLTVLTAPAALFVAITGWKKPRSLVQPGRGKIVVAGLIALLQIGIWVVVGVSLALKK